MALDFFAIASQGVLPTPTPTNAIRAALAVSQGLLNITLPAPPDVDPDFISWGGFAFAVRRFGRKLFGVR